MSGWLEGFTQRGNVSQQKPLTPRHDMWLHGNMTPNQAATIVATVNTADVLRSARGRIARPSKWYRGYYRDDSNRSNDECAVCALGAIRWAVWGSPHPLATSDWRDVHAANDAVERVTQQRLSRFNDSAATTHADVLAAFDKAIARECVTGFLPTRG